MFYNFHLAFCDPPPHTNGYLEFSDNNGVHDVDSKVTYIVLEVISYLTTTENRKMPRKQKMVGN